MLRAGSKKELNPSRVALRCPSNQKVWETRRACAVEMPDANVTLLAGPCCRTSEPSRRTSATRNLIRPGELSSGAEETPSRFPSRLHTDDGRRFRSRPRCPLDDDEVPLGCDIGGLAALSLFIPFIIEYIIALGIGSSAHSLFGPQVACRQTFFFFVTNNL